LNTLRATLAIGSRQMAGKGIRWVQQAKRIAAMRA
jgi:hypothetical protein